MNIIESYLLNDKTISIDLDKFESGEIPRLLIIGYSGSGKTTIGIQLAKKYKKEFRHLDGCWIDIAKKYKDEKDKGRQFQLCILSSIKQKGIIDGIQILMHEEFKIDKNYLMKQPIIILGTSLIVSSLKAAMRNSKEGIINDKGEQEEMSFIQSLKWQGYHTNFKNLKNKIKQFRKDRIAIKGSNIKEFIIPKQL
tara:strand:- start:1414 stop:1998 length:585 start_codon:yes stop_codon:yes gene_type:complete